MRYAEVLLPLPLANTFTYRIPEAMAQLTGLYCLVAAPFGNKHFYTGIVVEIHDRCPEQPFEIKELLQLLDGKPVIGASQLSFWQWMSSYYLCTLGEVFKAALPAGFKIESTTQRTGFKPKTATYLRLADHIQTEADLHDANEKIKHAKLQEKLFYDFLELSGMNKKTVSMKRLLAYSGISASVLNGLRKRGILVAEEQIESRIESLEGTIQEEKILTGVQLKAYEEIQKSFVTNDITLLHSDLSVGRIEIYIRLIQDVMSKGLRALYLLPEITLSMQITALLRKVFGSKLFVYNSGISDNERVEIWNQIRQADEPFVVLGVRSSLFLPFDRLGLVIVDDEQEASYKQHDPAPRYHARNAAMMLALQQGAKTLLGSATPSLESWLWAIKGKYGYVKTDDLDEGCLKPGIDVVNVSELRRKKIMKDTLFSPLLKERIDEALSKSEQVIIFQNRRGFAPLVACRLCGEIPHCVNCDVSLAYHKQMHRLTCHYCGYSEPFTARCRSCSGDGIKIQGFGTEKVEEEVAALFPHAITARLDFDTARKESAYRRILNDFEEGNTQILIGTQMVSKALNVANVSVVGILNVDTLTNIPDFRAYERAFHLILQLSGCTVESGRQGRVVIQTSQRESELLQMVRRFDYQGMAQTQLKERHLFRYPPYTRLILLVLRSQQEKILDEMAEMYAQRLSAKFGSSVSGPVHPPVTRIQTIHVRNIMLKIELSVTASDARKMLEEVQSAMRQDARFRQITLHYDVDPQ